MISNVLTLIPTENLQNKKTFLEAKGRSARKADNLTAIYEPIV
jgi:hypothetical protein